MPNQHKKSRTCSGILRLTFALDMSMDWSHTAVIEAMLLTKKLLK